MGALLALQPCRLSPEILKAPLPFDLYSGNGTLLSRQGSRLKGNPETLLSQSLFRPRLDSERNEVGALRRLESLIVQYGQQTESWSCSIENVRQLKLLAGELVELCAAHSDVCVSMAAYLPGATHAIRHSFAVAIHSIVLGSALGLDTSHLHTLARAALTMNLSLLSYHDDWASIRGTLSVLQMNNVHRHPFLSSDLLSQSPGVDLNWITAVDQHHENFDGSGYPLGLKGELIALESRVLRAADMWCALVLDRSGRGRKPPRLALHELSGSVRGHLDYQIFVTLKKLMGCYPPGTLTRLSNRETALVVRWDRNGPLPRSVVSIISASGETMREFNIRNVSQSGFGIRDYAQLNLAQISRIRWPRVWESS